MNSQDVEKYCRELARTIQRFGADSASDEDCAFLMTERIIDARNISNDWYRVDFKNGVFKVGSNGGLIAYMPPNSTLQIEVYGSDLSKMTDINLPWGFELCDFYVTPEDLIVCISKSSLIHIYDCRGTCVNAKYILPEGADEDVTLSFASFYQDGCFLIYFNGDIYHIQNYNFLTIEKWCTVDCPITFVRACKSYQSGDEQRAPSLWIYSSDTNKDFILCCQRNQQTKLNLGFEITDLKFSYDCSLVALMTVNPDSDKEKMLNIYDIEMESCFASIKLGAQKPKSFEFCCDTVLLTTISNFNYELSTIGAASKKLAWDVDQLFITVPEVDGARIIMQNQVVLMRVIPQTGKNGETNPGYLDFLQKPDSCPGMQLVRALTDKKTMATTSPLSMFFINTEYDPNKISLVLAITQCLNVAEFFSSFPVRKLLLEVVAKAKTYLDYYDHQSFSNALRSIRLSHNLDDPPLNMPMTAAEISDLGAERLVIRLCNRYHHAYAQPISEFLSQPYDVSQHWAHCMVHSTAPIDKIVKLLEKPPMPVDYIDLARFAFSLNKKALGEALLKLNTDKAKGVPFHIKNKNWKAALEDAVASNDEALVIHVLQEAHKVNQDALALEFVAKNDIALAAYLMISDNPDPQLYVNSGRPTLATCYQFDAAREKGSSKESLQQIIQFAKTQKDGLGRSVIEAYQNYISQRNNTDKNCYETLSNIVDQNERSAKNFAKSVNFDESDILWSKVYKWMEIRDDRLIIDIWQDFKEHDIITFFDMLIDEKCDEQRKQLNKQLIAQLYQLIPDQSTKESVQNHFDVVQYSPY